MKNPLQNFNWDELYEKYDIACHGFNSASLYIKHTKAKTDRELYYWLVKTFSDRRNINLKNYKSLLYWKLYSQPAAVANILRRIGESLVLQSEIKKRLQGLKEILPKIMPKNEDEIISLITCPEISIYGMGDRSTLPTRSTFLHFIYPNVMPVFDKMVLQAVGVSERNSNHKIGILKEYLPFAWGLAEKYGKKIKNKFPESPIRLIDMALWVVRGNDSKKCSWNIIK